VIRVPLPAPNLDDRRFQDFVDDAKRFVQQRCPEWTDHNVSDPGVTLIEAFAQIADQLFYRLNRVPDRLYLKFLELIGVRLHAPTAARAALTFWLAGPKDHDVSVPADTLVATSRTGAAEAVAFATLAPLTIVSTAFSKAVSEATDGSLRDHTAELQFGPFACFSTPPRAGESLLVGLTHAAPSCAVSIRVDCRIEGVGVDPLDPPLAWEAWDGLEWQACEVDSDETGGLNRAGAIVLHLPPSHRDAVLSETLAGWIRCRVTEPRRGQPFYTSSPQVRSLSVVTVGGTAPAVHAERIDGELVGISDGTPGQVFSLRRTPVVLGLEPVVLEVGSEDGWEAWEEVDSFAASGPADRHFILDPVAGQVLLPPATRAADGALEAHGAIPEKGAALRVRSYRTGGGRRGNVAAGSLRVLKTPIVHVSRAENRQAASGGVDGELVDEARVRGPISLRSLGRAVTAEDFELLAREAAPNAARIRCLPATEPGEAGGVRVLVVPAVADDEDGELPFERLIPPPELLSRITEYLDTRRVIGTRVVVEPPSYQGVTVVCVLRPRLTAEPTQLAAAARQALYTLLHPLRGGGQGLGWPFGRPVHVGEIFATLQRVDGVDLVEDVRLYPADPLSGERGSPVQRIDLGAHTLAYSYSHEVRVSEPWGIAE